MTPFYDFHKMKTLVTRVRWIYCLSRRSASLTQYLDGHVSDILSKYQYTLALLLWLINAVCVSINVFFREEVFAHLNFCKIKFLANKTRDLYADAHFSPSFSWRCIFRLPPPPYTSSFFAFVQTSGRGFNFPLSAFLLLQNSTPPSLLYSGAFLHNTCSGKRLTARNDLLFPRPMGTRCGGGLSYKSSTFPSGVSWRTFPCMFTCAYVAFVIVSDPPLLFCLLLLTALELQRHSQFPIPLLCHPFAIHSFLPFPPSFLFDRTFLKMNISCHLKIPSIPWNRENRVEFCVLKFSRTP